MELEEQEQEKQYKKRNYEPKIQVDKQNTRIEYELPIPPPFINKFIKN